MIGKSLYAYYCSNKNDNEGDTNHGFKDAYFFMKQIGILSDTHGFLNPALFKFFENCDEIWHAGDWGPNVAEQLLPFKPLRGVYGNIDDQKIRSEFPEILSFDCEGVNVFMIHIAGYPGHYAPNFKKITKNYSPQLLICGHSHILRVMKDPTFNWLLLNPGACGNHGFQKVNTAVRLKIDQGKMLEMEVWEQKRG